MKYLIILFFLFTNYAFSEETDSKYTLTSNGKVKIITEHKYSDKHYYKNYVINGTFEDNFGNYGSNDVAVFAEYKDAPYHFR